METPTVPVPVDLDAQKERNKALLALLDEWQNDTSGYEEDNAEAIDRALNMAYTEPFRLREPSTK